MRGHRPGDLPCHGPVCLSRRGPGAAGASPRREAAEHRRWQRGGGGGRRWEALGVTKHRWSGAALPWAALHLPFGSLRPSSPAFGVVLPPESEM